MIARPTFLAAAFGLCTSLALTAPASAQTPGQYCTTVSGCEILDVSIGGGFGGTSTESRGVALIKYCKNSQLNVVPAYVHASSFYQQIRIDASGGAAGNDIDLAYLNGGSGFDALNNADCDNLP